jgi:hypothetical protein
VSTQGLLLAVALGAAALAMWLDVRLEPRTPRTVTWTLAHTAGSLMALQALPGLLVLVVAGGDSPARKIGAVMLVLLPVLTYCWLAAIWLLKLVQRAAHMRS